MRDHEAGVLGAAHRFGWSATAPRGARIAVGAALVAVVVEAATHLIGTPGSLWVGGLPVSPSLIPLAVVGVACGRRGFGRARSHDAAITFWVLCVLALAVGALPLSRGRPPEAVVSLVLSGFVEEFMYRGAIPAMVAFALVSTGFAVRRAGLAGMIVGSACFVVLPGHAAQMESMSDALPFAAFAALMAMAVWRTGALFEVALFHAVLNTLNISRMDGTAGSSAAVMLIGLFVVLMIAYIPSIFDRDRLIDLTGPEPVVLEDGRTARSPVRVG
jgi:membrane protease YdiL (CAAX protease family)